MLPLCSCQTLPEEELLSDYPRVVSEFEPVRMQCQALRDLLIPDPDWADFRAHMLQDADPLHHRPALMLAFMRRYLAQITIPVHNYLFHNGNVHPSLSNNYAQDLRERWMRESDLYQRHRKYNMYIGKVTELQLIQWLVTSRGWEMKNLAALGGPNDISAEIPDYGPSSVEVKHAGETLEGLIIRLNGVGGNPDAAKRLQAHVAGPTDHFQNLIDRFENAISQLKGRADYRIAVVVVDQLAWQYFSVLFRPPHWQWRLQEYLLEKDSRVDEKWLILRRGKMEFQCFPT